MSHDDANLEGASDPERRQRRSDDPITALHYQLAHTRHAAELEAVVLVDESGCLVAGAGAWAICEELAAFAPLLANQDAIKSEAVTSRVAALSNDVAVKSFVIDGSEVLLCGRGGSDAREGLLARATAGCARILAAA